MTSKKTNATDKSVANKILKTSNIAKGLDGKKHLIRDGKKTNNKS